jgi:hypothetical protein
MKKVKKELLIIQRNLHKKIFKILTNQKSKIKKMKKELKILCAFDKFKGTLSSNKAGKLLIQSLKEKYENLVLKSDLSSISDGGDGFTKYKDIQKKKKF